MSGLFLLLPTFLVIVLSLLIVRAGAIALAMTGMDEKIARFQALSAFTRTGFTTREAELITRNPRRRTIVTWLMILGNAGIITVIVTATSSLASTTSGSALAIGTVLLIASVILVYLIARFTPLSKMWERFVEKRFVDSEFFEEGVSEDLLHLSEGYGLVKIFVTEDSPLIGHTLFESNTPENAFWVVGIERGKDWISLPRSRERIEDKDRLIVYGNIDQLKSIFGKSKIG
jgi:galactitol-specific phosphotransferase system IIC component